ARTPSERPIFKTPTSCFQPTGGRVRCRHGPKKKGKAPKKTKEELEEERRLQEEEEARQRAEEERRLEEERKKRELEEARRREEEARNRASELDRLQQEHEATKHDLEAKAHRLAEILRIQKEGKDWEKYLACEPRPDAHVEGDMNSFLNSWILEEVSTDVNAVTASCNNAHQVILDLEYVGANAKATNDPALAAQCQAFVDKIERMINEKIEYATAHILQYADEYTDINSRSEVRMASATRQMKLGLWINLIAKGSRNKRIDFQELGISVDLPKAVVIQTLALRVSHLPFDPFSPINSQNIDFALGGIYSIDLMAIPPPPKRARGWMMREVTDSGDQIKRLHYPLEGMVASAALPIKVSIALPSDVLFSPTPRIGWWDPHSECWEEEGITEVVLHPDTNVLTFSTMKLTHLPVLQQRDLNYQKYLWHLKMSTTTANHAHLKMKTEHFDVIHFEISQAGARLLQPQLAQLSYLSNEWLEPAELLMKLSASGIGLCPTLEDDMRFGYIPKSKALEDHVIQEVVSIISAYEVSIGNMSLESNSGGMRWIGAIDNPKQIVFAVKEIFWPYIERRDCKDNNSNNNNSYLSASSYGEQAEPQHPASGSYINVLTEVVEDVAGVGVKFRIDRSEDPYDTHVHLKHALEEISSPDAKDRMENSNVMFEFVLMKLLSLLRMFSYSKPLSTSAADDKGPPQLDTEEEMLTSAVAVAAEALGIDDEATMYSSDANGAIMDEAGSAYSGPGCSMGDSPAGRDGGGERAKSTAARRGARQHAHGAVEIPQSGRDHLASFETGFPALVDEDELHETAKQKAPAVQCAQAIVANCAIPFTLLMSAIGAGTLAVPYTFLLLPTHEAVLMLCLVGIAMAFTADVILRVHVAMASRSDTEELRETYQELALHAGGVRLARIVSFFTAFAVFGACVGCVRVVRDMAPSLLAILHIRSQEAFDAMAPETQAAFVSRTVWSVFMVVILPLGFFKKISALRFSSYLGFTFSIYLVGAVAYRAITQTPSFDEAAIATELAPASLFTKFSHLSECIAIYNFTFMLHLNVIPLLAQVVAKSGGGNGKNKQRVLEQAERKMRYNVYAAVLVCVLLYATFGLCAMSIYGKDTQGNILLNLSHDPIMVVPRVAILFTILFSFPLLFHPLRSLVLELRCCGENPTLRTQVVVSVILLVAQILCAMRVPGIQVVFSFVGSGILFLLCYVMPAIFYTQLVPWRYSTAGRFTHALLWVLVAISCVFCSLATVQAIFKHAAMTVLQASPHDFPSPLRTHGATTVVPFTSLKRASRLSEFNVFITLLMSLVGAGMLSVPYTFVLIPLWQALAGVVVVGVAMAATAVALLQAHVELARQEEARTHIGAGKKYVSFHSIAVMAGGKVLGMVVSVTTFIDIYGSCIGCVRIVRDMTPHVAKLLYSIFSDTRLDGSSQKRVADAMLWGTFVVVVLPLCVMKNLSSLRIVSYLSFLCSIYLAGAIIYRSYHAFDDDTAPYTSNHTATHAFDETAGVHFQHLAQSVSIYIYVFMMHPNLLPLFTQLRGNFHESLAKTQSKMVEAIVGVAVFAVIFYSALGFFASQLYSSINGNILLNLKNDPLMQAPVAAVYVTVILTFPMLFHPLRTIAEEIVWRSAMPEVAVVKRWIGAIILLWSQLLIAIWVPGIEVVFGLIGGTTCLAICFVFPVIAFTRLVSWRHRRCGRVAVAVLWLSVVVFAVTGITTTWCSQLSMSRFPRLRGDRHHMVTRGVTCVAFPSLACASIFHYRHQPRDTARVTAATSPTNRLPYHFASLHNSPLPTLTSSRFLMPLSSSSPAVPAHSPLRSQREPASIEYHTYKRSSLPDWNVFITLLMSVVGAGMLSVPYTFVLVPLWQALAGIVLVGATMGCTGVAFVHAHTELAKKEELFSHAGAGKKFVSFKAIAIQAGGERVGKIVSSITGVGIFGGCVGGVRIVRDMTPYVVTRVVALWATDVLPQDQARVIADAMLWVIFLGVVLPVCLKKDLSSLRVVSYLSFVCSIYLVGAIIYRAYNAVDDLAVIDPMHTPTGSPLARLTQSISIYNFAFMMHLNMVPLFHQLRGDYSESLAATRSKMTEIIVGVVLFVIILYSAFGFFTSQLYGQAINGNVLLNLKNDKLMEIPVVAVYLTVIFTFPMLFHPLRTIVEESVNVGERRLHRLGISTALMVAQVFVAMCVPGIQVVFALTGATCCLLICFVFPLFAFTRLATWRDVASLRIAVFGLWALVAVFALSRCSGHAVHVLMWTSPTPKNELVRILEGTTEGGHPSAKIRPPSVHLAIQKGHCEEEHRPLRTLPASTMPVRDEVKPLLGTRSSSRLSQYSDHGPRSPFETGFPMVFPEPAPSPRPHRLSFSYSMSDRHRELHVFSTLLMSVVGAGMLSVPYTFVLIPTWEALLGIVVVGVSMGLTATALLKAHVQLAAEEEGALYIGAGKKFSSFQSIAILAGGDTFGYVVSIVTAIGIYGGCVGCIRIVRDIAPFIVSLTYSMATGDPAALAAASGTRYADYIMWLSFILIVFPLCLLKNLSGLRVSSYLGFAFSIYLVIAVIYRSYHQLDSASTAMDVASAALSRINGSSSGDGAVADVSSVPVVSPEPEAIHVIPTVVVGSLVSRFAQSISIYNYAFMMHLNLLPLFIQLRGSFTEPLQQSSRKMKWCIAGVVVFCVLLYAIFGLYAERLYDGTIRGNVLLNLENDPVMDVPLVAVYLTVVLSFPLLFHPLRGVIEELVFTTTINDISFMTRLGGTTVLLLSQLLVAIWVPVIEVVFALTGASSCLMICFVFPVVLFTRLYPWRSVRGGKVWIVGLWAIVAFFTFIGIVATWFLLVDIHRQ
ncbi:TPA: LOW QUALITY PROTEIN: hypothetical protein N0F65_012139, partial [Lagenidium giganteum]